MTRLFAALSLLSCILLSGCIKDDEFDKIASSSWDPELAVPLVNSNMTIRDIINVADSGMFVVDSTRLVVLVYRSTLYSVDPPELISVSLPTDIVSVQLDGNDSTALVTSDVDKVVNRQLPLNLTGNSVLTSLAFSSAKLNVEINSDIPLNGTLNVSIPAAILNGSPFSRDIPFTSGNGNTAVVQSEFDLAGYQLNLTGNNELGLVYTVRFPQQTTSQAVTSLDYVIKTRIDTITPSAAYGNIGSQQLTINQDTTEINFFDNFQNGNVYFEDPRLTFRFYNSFGIPVQLSVSNITAVNNQGTTYQLSGFPSPVQIPYPTVPGQTAVDSVVLTSQNSSIQQAMAINPKYIIYTVTATTTTSAVSNFVLDTSSFITDVSVNMPLRGYASNFSIQDTTDFTLEEVEDIESATFRINILNGFPATATTQVYFTDENFNVLDSIFTDSQSAAINSASVDTSGKVTAPSLHQSEETFTSARIANLYRAKKILVRSNISTTDAPTRIVEIYDYYNLEVKIGVRTKIKVTL